MQRKFSSDSIFLPNKSFDSKIFLIPLSNELYDSGMISLVNPKIEKIKFKLVYLNFENNIFSNIIYCQSKKQEVTMNLFFEKYIQKNPNLIFEKTKEGKLFCWKIIRG